MKVFFLIYSLQGGGAERMVARLANGFSARGHEVSIGLFCKENIVYELNSVVKIADLGNNKKNKVSRCFSYVFSIRSYLRLNKQDVIFAFMASMIPFAVLGKVGGIKVIGAERTNPKTLNRVYRKLSFYFSQKCDGFVFQTKGAKSCYPLKTQRHSAVIGNIAPSVESGTVEKIENSICTAGRLHIDKDYPTLLNAMKLVVEKVPTANLTIYGKGPLEDELKRQTKMLGIEKNVNWVGFSEHLPEEMQKYQIFAFSSKAEGMPNVLLEAMASGLPCVSTDCEFGPAELIKDGENGYLVPVGDADLLARKIVELINDAEIRRKMAADAKKVVDEYSYDRILSKYEDYAKQVLLADNCISL